MAKEFKVSFDHDGNQLSWEGYGYEVKEKKDNYEFKATLLYNGFSRGRSALNICWKDQKTGKTFESGMALLDTSLLGKNHSKAVCYLQSETFSITGIFTFKKQGTAILLTLK